MIDIERKTIKSDIKTLQRELSLVELKIKWNYLKDSDELFVPLESMTKKMRLCLKIRKLRNKLRGLSCKDLQ